MRRAKITPSPAGYAEDSNESKTQTPRKIRRGKMAPIIGEAVPVGSRPPAAVRVRISTGERHGFSVLAPSPTRTSSQQGRAGGSGESAPKLVSHIGSGSTLFTEKVSPCFSRAAAASSVSLRALVSDFMPASVSRRWLRHTR